MCLAHEEEDERTVFLASAILEKDTVFLLCTIPLHPLIPEDVTDMLPRGREMHIRNLH